MKFKNMQFPEDEYYILVERARQAGYRVQRGPASQLRQFVMDAAKAYKGKAKVEKKVIHGKR